MAHNASEMRGISTCAPVDTSSAAEALRACEKSTTRHAEKLAAAASIMLKAKLQAIAIDACEKTRQRQATLYFANSAWARCAYEDRLVLIYDLSRSAVIARQAIEARYFGVAMNADGWSSNPQHRPMLGCMCETPSVVRMAAAVDTSSAASSCEHLWSKFKGVWSDARASLGVATATKLVMLGSNLHIERKMFDLDIDRNLIKWQTEPEESDDEA
jgi:hypothetical protein